jgi:hypothetical protein
MNEGNSYLEYKSSDMTVLPDLHLGPAASAKTLDHSPVKHAAWSRSIKTLSHDQRVEESRPPGGSVVAGDIRQVTRGSKRHDTLARVALRELQYPERSKEGR